MDDVLEDLARSAMKLIGAAAVVAVLDAPAAMDKSQEERTRVLGRAVLEKLGQKRGGSGRGGREALVLRTNRSGLAP